MHPRPDERRPACSHNLLINAKNPSSMSALKNASKTQGKCSENLDGRNLKTCIRERSKGRRPKFLNNLDGVGLLRGVGHNDFSMIRR